MYVQCERCKTEYDFDDALVSERGTTVKCTSCGHQFKVRRTVAEGAQDKWTVTTRAGSKLVFTTLRELQKAIIAKQVSRQDLLSRGEGPPRPLASIAELEPFFDERRSSRPPPPDMKPPATGGVPPVRKPTATSPGLPPPARPRIDTLRPTADLGAAVPPPTAARIHEASSPLAKTITALDQQETSFSGPNPALVRPARVAPPIATVAMPDANTPTAPKRAVEAHAPPRVSAPPAHTPSVPHAAPVSHTPSVPHAAVHSASAPPVSHAPSAHAQTSPLAHSPSAPAAEPRSEMASTVAMPTPPPAPVIVQAQPGVETSSPLPPRVERPSYDDAAPQMGALLDQRPRRRMGGWVMALVLVLGIGAIGAFVAKPYLAGGTKPTSTTGALDPKVEALVTDGERAMGDGNLDGAKESFDKASALAEKDPHVLLDVARLAAITADVAWLDTKLEPNAGSDEGKAKRRRLEELGVKARHAADDALSAAPDDLGAVRVKIDALRIMGDKDGARALAPRISATSTQPDTAYVLAALDLSEADPPYKSVIERLRAAAMGEGNLGRAQALLVFALMKSGDAAEAKRELGKLGQLPRPHPLLGTLRAALDRAPVAVATADGGAPVAVVDVNALPTNVPTGTGGGGGTDPRALLAQADAAKNRGEYDRAKTLYGQVLEKDANDSEALAGLGDVSHKSHDLPNALTYYRRALAVNQSFVPALIGLGDVQWEQGDKAGAQKTYKEIVDRFPESAYPSYVKQRLEGGGGGGGGGGAQHAAEDAGEPR